MKPIYPSDEENDAVLIATSEEFEDAFAYLRAVMNANELSERALELTQTCIGLNAANYTVWQYRREILRVLGRDIAQELLFSEDVIADNPKNYQVWHHRKTLVDESGKYEAELDFIAVQLQDEPKNYHAWQYRQWLVERFNLFSMDELNFSTACIFEDIRNNSAWNYRFFIGANLSDCFQEEKFLQNEITFTLKCIRKAPSNESTWAYLSGILANDPLPADGGPDRADIVACTDELLANEPVCPSPHLYLFLIDSLVDKMRKCDDQQKIGQSLAKALKYLDVLEQVDPIRHNFWQYKRHSLHNLSTGF